MVSPALSATVVIIVTTVISVSAYLCFLRYVCSGCCKATQEKKLEDGIFEMPMRKI